MKYFDGNYVTDNTDRIAIAVDQTIKKRQETSIIISSLAPGETTPNSQLISGSCTTEFHLLLNIVLLRGWAFFRRIIFNYCLLT